MGNLLYLVHRLPYPPNKGDKVRSYHLLRHLTARHRVFLGTFVDDQADEAYVDTVKKLCPDVCVVRLNPRSARLRSLVGLLTHKALSLHYYQNANMQAWVNRILGEHKIDAVVIFSSVMAQYVQDTPGQPTPPMLVDFVDVDSAKWSDYAPNHFWPLSWLYRREGERLLSYERAVATRSHGSFFVTEKEAALFRTLAPECAGMVQAISNGVDADFFSPDPMRPSPFAGGSNPPDQIPLVFTGAMDYWPNIDAVTWFANAILPQLRQKWPHIRFFIVGRNPPPSVQALASDAIVVTGTVPDVRPYLQHAAVVVAPLRVARGIQNKILEAMAMGRPVVASQSCVQAIEAQSGEDLMAANEDHDFIREIGALLQFPARAASMGKSGRAKVVQHYSWAAHLAAIDQYLDGATPTHSDPRETS